MKPGALEKRIKRQVTAREHTFFVVVSPGLEQVCLRELKKLFPENRTITLVDGGVEFQGPLTACYQANLNLRTASRIMMRIAGFKASGFGQLEQKVAEIPWELYLGGRDLPEISVSAHKSRLYHSGAVAERFQAAIRMGLSGITDSTIIDTKGKAPALFVRAVNDRFVVSIDSSGDLLYRRGLKIHGGKAPLRETLAAGCLMLAGYTGKRPLIDPMCGTGSFSIEAALMAKKIPPGWFRSFAFQEWPCFRQGAWNHIRREAEATMNDDPVPPVMASDRNAEACSRLSRQVSEAGYSDVISVSETDFFSIRPESMTSETGVAIVNPPYGVRLGSRKESEELVADMVNHFEKVYKGWRVGIISPFSNCFQSKKYRVKKHTLLHGGLKLWLVTATIS